MNRPKAGRYSLNMLKRFSFFKKRAFRSGVRVSMSYLVGFSEILDSMLKIYPGILTAIEQILSKTIMPMNRIQQ